MNSDPTFLVSLWLSKDFEILKENHLEKYNQIEQINYIIFSRELQNYTENILGSYDVNDLENIHNILINDLWKSIKSQINYLKISKELLLNK